jgi:CRP-like cAMP-binding protein
MDIQKAELLRDVSNDFVKAIQAITTKENHEPGIIIFHAGDPATHLYILLMGKVKLIIGETGHVIHMSPRGSG